MNCPDCNLYMDLVSINGFDVNWCYQCNGIWLTPKKLEEILAVSERKDIGLLKRLLQETGSISKRHCPECIADNLVEHNVDTIIIDQCKNCGGVFFEKGELNKLAPNAKRDQNDDLNYQEVPYSPTDYFNIELDEKIDDKRKSIGSMQSIIVFLLIMALLALKLFLLND